MSDPGAASTCGPCATAAGCPEHKLFTCASCGRLTPWLEAGDDELPNGCSECWVKRFSPEARAQPSRSWPPNTGCDPPVAVSGCGDQGAAAGLLPDAQVVDGKTAIVSDPPNTDLEDPIIEMRRQIDSLTAENERLRGALVFKYNDCFLNRYDSAPMHLGWHSDDSPVRHIQKSIQDVCAAMVSVKIPVMWPRVVDDEIEVPLIDGISFEQLMQLSAVLETTEIYVDVVPGVYDSESGPCWDHAALTIRWPSVPGPRGADDPAADMLGEDHA